MRLVKLIWFDLKNGCLKSPSTFLYPVLLTVFCFLEVGRKNQIWEKSIGIGDYWVYLYGGMREYIPSPGNPFTFPIVWMVLFLMGAFVVLNYPLNDLQKTGVQILTRTEGRSFWWLSKCIWNLTVSTVYHGMIFLTLGILCRIFRVPFIWKLNPGAVSGMFGVFLDEIPSGQIPFSVLCAPIMLSVAVNMFQMMLTLFLKPMFSFLFSSALFLVSTYIMSPVMLGNYGMVLRMKWMNEQGVPQITGFLVCLLILGFSVLVGMVRFRRMDILNEE